MICNTCQGDSAPSESSPRYCPACDGYGATCDACGKPALHNFPDLGLCLCLGCSIDRIDRRYHRTMLICTVISIGAVILLKAIL